MLITLLNGNPLVGCLAEMVAAEPQSEKIMIKDEILKLDKKSAVTSELSGCFCYDLNVL